MKVMNGRVLKQDDAGRKLETAHDDVHGGTATRPINVEIHQVAGDVLVAAQRVEVVLVVVIQRGLVAKPLPGRIRIVVDVEIERVVVNLGRACSGHRDVFLSDSASGNTTSPTRLR